MVIGSSLAAHASLLMSRNGSLWIDRVSKIQIEVLDSQSMNSRTIHCEMIKMIYKVSNRDRPILLMLCMLRIQCSNFHLLCSLGICKRFVLKI